MIQMTNGAPCTLLLADGLLFHGRSFGAPPDGRPLELVFNTSMTGYQEILTDPSYTGQAIVMSYPLIGNYGVNAEDDESACLRAGALIVREANPDPSNFRSRNPLPDVMAAQGVPGIEGIDTRMLVRHIRANGTQMAVLLPGTIQEEDPTFSDALASLRKAKPWTDSVSLVSQPETTSYASAFHWYKVAVIDCGIKENILRSLLAGGADVVRFPWNTSAAEIEAIRPDGIFISNGPGDPADIPETARTIAALLGRYPIFGICLGHQLIARAYGARTYKLHFGHRGGNHPVMNLLTGKIEITSQNHSYAVDEESLTDTGLYVTHRNLLDGTIEGLAHRTDPTFSVQYHPESAPGPQDSAYLFSRFYRLMEGKTYAETY